MRITEERESGKVIPSSNESRFIKSSRSVEEKFKSIAAFWRDFLSQSNNIAYCIGTFIFGALPVFFAWLNQVDNSHHIQGHPFWNGAEGWIYSITIAAAVFTDIASETRLDTAKKNYLSLVWFLIVIWSTFQYSHMLSEGLPISSATINFYKPSEITTVILCIILALSFKASQHILSKCSTSPKGIRA